jgi:transposase
VVKKGKEGESLRELVEKQAKTISEQAEIISKQAALIEKQAETIKRLEARIVELETLVRAQQETIARLQKDSRTSSKPPSSDIVKPKPPSQPINGGKKRKIGGQKGHKKHERVPFPPDRVDQVIEVTLDTCPECGGPLQECEEVVTKQQIDMVEKPFIVTEYHYHTYTCPGCQTGHTASEPEGTGSGLFSVGLIALVAYLKGRCHISYRGLKGFFQDVLGIVISSGFLAKQIKKASGALQGVHQELVDRLKGEGHLFIDESGWKENGEKRWIWAFRAERYAVFLIRDSRKEAVLEEVLGKEYEGIISCDFFAAYRMFYRESKAMVQFCWAHLIREVLFLLKLEEEEVRRYGRRVIKQIKAMFETIHRQDKMGVKEWEERMRGHQEKIVRRATGTVPEQKEARLIAKRMREWEEEYFGFIGAGIEATNNPAERTIRQMVLDRAVTQGSRGLVGNEWHERFWSVLTTCDMQNKPVMEYLKECLSAYFGTGLYPSLINPA